VPSTQPGLRETHGLTKKYQWFHDACGLFWTGLGIGPQHNLSQHMNADNSTYEHHSYPTSAQFLGQDATF